MKLRRQQTDQQAMGILLYERETIETNFYLQFQIFLHAKLCFNLRLVCGFFYFSIDEKAINQLTIN
jgi:hypothetical protein